MKRRRKKNSRNATLPECSSSSRRISAFFIAQKNLIDEDDRRKIVAGNAACVRAVRVSESRSRASIQFNLILFCEIIRSHKIQMEKERGMDASRRMPIIKNDAQ